jgi:hypothetical protein
LLGDLSNQRQVRVRRRSIRKDPAQGLEPSLEQLSFFAEGPILWSDQSQCDDDPEHGES